MKKTAWILSLAFLLTAGRVAFADTIILKNGTQYKGAVLRETKEEVEVIIDAGIIRFRRAEVASIKKGSVWENNAYLKKAQDYGAPVPAAKKLKAKETVVEDEAAAPSEDESSSELALREKEIELRRQEMELKRMELEIQREELRLKRDALERTPAVAEPPGVTIQTVPVERVKAAPPVKEEIFEEEEAAASEEEIAAEEEAALLKKKITEEEARQIAIEEQQKEQERKDRIESQRRLQEIRQKQEGVTIRGKVRPAGGEEYDTY